MGEKEEKDSASKLWGNIKQSNVSVTRFRRRWGDRKTISRNNGQTFTKFDLKNCEANDCRSSQISKHKNQAQKLLKPMTKILKIFLKTAKVG